MVMSVGLNPVFRNSKKTLEVHILHHFDEDFYGEELRVLVLGYLRPEAFFPSIEDLKKAIQQDIQLAEQLLDPPENDKYYLHPLFQNEKNAREED